MGRRSRSATVALVVAATVLAGCGRAQPSGTPTATSAPSSPAPTSAAPGPSPTVTSTTTPVASVTTRAPTGSTPTSPASTPAPSPTAPGSCGIPARLRGTDVTAIPGTAKVVALTFDAGGDTSGVEPILETLATTGTPATFFLTGRFADAHPAIARRIAGRYPIGNHTQDHLDLTRLSESRARSQIRTGAATITAVTGTNPRPYFRFPMGAVTPALVRLVNAECYVPVRWSVDTLGWQGTDPRSSSGGMSAEKVLARVLAGLKPGAIVLMHVGANPDDHTTFDADALPQVIDGVRARGYTLVDLSRLLPDTP